MTLFSYVVRYDTGAAPNPFGGVCTLVICKPAIRRVAEPGDWIVGLGSATSPIGDLSGKVVYAMRVTQRMTMREYDGFCRTRLRVKIPDWENRNPQRVVGDCIYDFSEPSSPRIRRSVHDEGNMPTDLGGRNALLSHHFYYLGDRAIPLPTHLLGIVHQAQGHKSRANDPFIAAFIAWIDGLGLTPNHLYGQPQRLHEFSGHTVPPGTCSARDLADDESDREVRDEDDCGGS